MGVSDRFYYLDSFKDKCEYLRRVKEICDLICHDDLCETGDVK